MSDRLSARLADRVFGSAHSSRLRNGLSSCFGGNTFLDLDAEGDGSVSAVREALMDDLDSPCAEAARQG